jgi:hypothetical protein
MEIPTYDAVVTIRLTTAQKAAFEAAANKRGKRAGVWAREVLVAAAANRDYEKSGKKVRHSR